MLEIEVVRANDSFYGLTQCVHVVNTWYQLRTSNDIQGITNQ